MPERWRFNGFYTECTDCGGRMPGSCEGGAQASPCNCDLRASIAADKILESYSESLIADAIMGPATTQDHRIIQTAMDNKMKAEMAAMDTQKAQIEKILGRKLMPGEPWY